MASPKRHFLLISGAMTLVLVLTLVLPMALIVWVDPLRVLYAHQEPQRHFYGEDRYWPAGVLAQRLRYQRNATVAVIGSSALWNTSARDLERFCGYKDPALMIISALSPEALMLLYKETLQAGCVRDIILAVEPWTYFTDQKRGFGYFPATLYKGTFFEKLEQSARRDIVMMALRILRGKEPESSQDRLVAEMVPQCAARLYSSMENYEVKFADFQRQRDALVANFAPPQEVSGVFPNLEALIDLLAASPETVRVNIIIPPRYIGHPDSIEGFDNYCAGLRRLVAATEKPGNVRVFAFDDMPVITNNRANYKDDLHFGVGVTRYMQRAMASGRHRISADSLDSYLERVWQNRKYGNWHYDPDNTVSFEGPMNEAAFAVFPLPDGPRPLSLP